MNPATMSPAGMKAIEIARASLAEACEEAAIAVVSAAVAGSEGQAKARITIAVQIDGGVFTVGPAKMECAQVGRKTKDAFGGGTVDPNQPELPEVGQ